MSRHCPARWRGRARGRSPSGADTARRLSTVAGRAGGPARSSAEALVMGAERRGRVIRGCVRSINQKLSGRSRVDELKSPGKPFEISEAGCLGGVGESQGKQGSARSGRGVDRGLREGSEGQPVQDLESDVVRDVLPAAGAGGGDREGTWDGHENARGARRRRQDRADSGGRECWRRGPNGSSTRTPTGTARSGPRWTRWLRAGERCWETDWVIDLDIRKFLDAWSHCSFC